MDEWGWEHLRPWLDQREQMPIGPLFCIVCGPTRGRPWSATAARAQLRRLAARAGVRRRQLRYAHAVEMAREGVPLNVIQRQLGHTDLGITSVYLQGIDNTEGDRRGSRPPCADDAGGCGTRDVGGRGDWDSRVGVVEQVAAAHYAATDEPVGTAVAETFSRPRRAPHRLRRG